MALGLIGVVVVAMFIATYLVTAYVLTVIARKTGHGQNEWFAWVPILQFVLMLDIAGQPRWYALVFVLSIALRRGRMAVVVGLASLILNVIVWIEIAKRRGKPPWMGVLAALPLVGLVGMLAIAAD